MNALEAVDKINNLNEQIEAVSVASDKLWSDVDLQKFSTILDGLKYDLEVKRDALSDKLRVISL